MPIGTVNKSKLYSPCQMLNQYLLLLPFCVFVCAEWGGGGVANLQGSLLCPSLFFFKICLAE